MIVTKEVIIEKDKIRVTIEMSRTPGYFGFDVVPDELLFNEIINFFKGLYAKSRRNSDKKTIG